MSRKDTISIQLLRDGNLTFVAGAVNRAMSFQLNLDEFPGDDMQDKTLTLLRVGLPRLVGAFVEESHAIRKQAAVVGPTALESQREQYIRGMELIRQNVQRHMYIVDLGLPALVIKLLSEFRLVKDVAMQSLKLLYYLMDLNYITYIFRDEHVQCVKRALGDWKDCKVMTCIALDCATYMHSLGHRLEGFVPIVKRSMQIHASDREVQVCALKFLNRVLVYKRVQVEAFKHDIVDEVIQAMMGFSGDMVLQSYGVRVVNLLMTDADNRTVVFNKDYLKRHLEDIARRSTPKKLVTDSDRSKWFRDAPERCYDSDRLENQPYEMDLELAWSINGLIRMLWG